MRNILRVTSDDDKKEWSVNEDKCYKNCDYADKMPQHTIVLSKEIWLIIQAMLRKYKDCEWQMLLTGELSEQGCFCTGYYITKQEVTGATVKHLDEITTAKIKEFKFVAGIHSHVNMGVTPSMTDIDDSIMSPIPYHLIVNNSLNMSGHRKAQLPCGGYTSAECGILVEGEVDLDAIEIKGTENIARKTYTAVGATQYDFDKDKKSSFGYGYERYDDEYYGGYADKMTTFDH